MVIVIAEVGIVPGHLEEALALEVAQARSRLGVSPRWPLATAVERTMTWYRAWAEGTDARALCEADIARWEAAA